MHLLKKVTLSIVLLCLIASPITHAYDLSSAWHKPEHRVWVIRGAALCAVFLAMLTYYSFFAHKQKYTPSSSTSVRPAADAPVMPTQDLVIHMKVEPSDDTVRDQSGAVSVASTGNSRFACTLAALQKEVEGELHVDKKAPSDAELSSPTYKEASISVGIVSLDDEDPFEDPHFDRTREKVEIELELVDKEIVRSEKTNEDRDERPPLLLRSSSLEIE